MPMGTPLHPRTSALCESLSYRDWSGYHAVSVYEVHHDHEYNAIRNAAALIDVSPLFKYLITGRDAGRLLDRIITRDVMALAVGQVYYTPWCDDAGKTIDDGTVMRLGQERYRLTAADPSLRWVRENAEGLQVAVDDVSEETAAIALQGPTSTGVLCALGVDVTRLKYFRMMEATIAGTAVEVSRTGYTGDLGYEIWMAAERAIDVWDALMAAGRRFGIRPTGLLALDMARVEAGLLLIDVDFHGSKKALIETHKYSPYEMGLDRLVQLEKPPFNGRDALAAEHRRGAARRIVGLEISWPHVEQLYEARSMPPQMPAGTSRAAVPVHHSGRQVGRATTTAWSPTLKKLIALATIDRPHFSIGTMVEVEITVDATRHLVPAKVVQTPFYNPRRKTATPVISLPDYRRSA